MFSSDMFVLYVLNMIPCLGGRRVAGPFGRIKQRDSGQVRQVRLRGLTAKSPSLSLSCSLETFVVVVIVVIQLLSVSDFAAPWTVGCQASLSFTISQTLLRFMSVEWVVLSKHLILCHPLLFLPSIFPSIFPQRHILILLSSQLYINILR